MNKRIETLMNQAREQYRNQNLPYEQGLVEYSEKFAELLVQNVLLELADVRLEHVFDPETDRVFGIAIDRIKTTFRS